MARLLCENMRRVVNGKNAEAPAIAIAQEAVEGEVADIATRAVLGVDVTAHGHDFTNNRSGNQTREFGRVRVF
jgi:hypothetical protein